MASATSGGLQSRPKERSEYSAQYASSPSERPKYTLQSLLKAQAEEVEMENCEKTF